MPKTKDLSRVVSKWAQNAGQASSSYAEGVQNPRNDWAQATAASAESYKQGVTKAAADGRFARGVARAGTAKQQNNALNKGVSRYSGGIAVAQPEYQTAMEPVLRTIQNVQLPPRKPKGDPSNIDRVKAIAAALHAQKTGSGK